MREKVLVYSRFPKSQMVRIGERFELLDAAGKNVSAVFSATDIPSLLRFLRSQSNIGIEENDGEIRIFENSR